MKLFAAFLLTLPGFAHAAPLDGVPEKVKQVRLATSTCDADLSMNSEIYPLTKDTKLVLVPCWLGAYNLTSAAYLVSSVGQPTETVSIVNILQYDSTQKAILATVDLINSEFDAKTHVLSTFAKARGIGDCGQSSKTVIEADSYNNVMIKTIEIRDKEKCDAKMTAWPVVFKQKR